MHSKMHPVLPKWGCVQLHRYQMVLHETIDECADYEAPRVPEKVQERLKEWAKKNREDGVREEVICCVHGLVHKQYTRASPRNLLIWQRSCAQRTTSWYGIAY